MTFTDGDDEGEWEVLTVPRGVDSNGVIYFLRRQLAEAERAQLGAAVSSDN